MDFTKQEGWVNIPEPLSQSGCTLREMKIDVKNVSGLPCKLGNDCEIEMENRERVVENAR